MTRTEPPHPLAFARVAVCFALLSGGSYCALGETAKTSSPTPAAPSPVADLERVLDRALAAYNAGDKHAFLAEFASAAPGILAEGAYRRLFEGYYRSEFGKLESKRLNMKASAPDPNWGGLIYEAKFQKRPKALLTANFIRENGTVKLMQIRFEYSEPAK